MNEEGIIIHTDGGARGNPGPAACAFVAEVEGKIIKEESEFLGNSTNNYAEYRGVILALNWLSINYQNFQEKAVTFNLDSELVARQLSGLYKVKNQKLIELFLQVNKLSKSISLKISYKNIPRSKNKLADLLVNQELDNNPSQ
jgi:ribonuclease HI